MVKRSLVRRGVGIRSRGDRHRFIEIHSWNVLRNSSGIPALFNLHVRVQQQKYISGFPRKPWVRVVRSWGQSRKERKTKCPEFHGRPVLHLLWIFYFVTAYHCEHRGKLTSWQSKLFVITQAPCRVEATLLRIRVGMRKGDCRHCVIEIHLWNFPRKETSFKLSNRTWEYCNRNT